MIEELIKMLRQMEGEAESILSDLHHLRAVIVAGDNTLDQDYILGVLDRVIKRME